jgi:eukaryotic-like serine/threonine-protein kinase
VPRDTAKQPLPNVEPYRDILVLGAGGMGEVRLAVAQGGFDVKKLVVLKTLRSEMLAEQNVRRMFLEEACLSARLAHPNVVHVHKVISGSNPVIVMEYLDGQSLSAIQSRARERLSTAMQLRILAHVLQGLHYSHELRDYDGTPLNIVHRDVSPQNVLVTYEGLVKVVDFGLAKAATERSRSKSGTIKGKIEYMPVEQMMGGEVDRRADIHAVGCMLWQACTGERLWANASEASIIRHLMTGNVPRPSSRRPVHPRLEAIVMKAMAFDPKDRYPTAFDLQKAIDEMLLQMPDAPSTREIATFVSELFAEQRKAMADLIGTAMSMPSLRLPHARSVPRTGASLRLPVRARSMARQLSVAGILSSVLVAGGVATWQLSLPGVGADSKPETAAQNPQLVTLRVSVSPRDAVMSIDQQLTRENPVTLRLPRDGVEHEVRATRLGYEPISKFVRLDNDLSLDLVLAKVASRSAPQVPATPGPIPSAPPGSVESSRHHAKRTRATDPPNHSCDPPFYYQSGMKIFNPKCL